MFTGIVQGLGKIIAIDSKSSHKTFKIELPKQLTTNLTIGASVAHDGCCLTVTDFGGNWLSFDAINETLTITTLNKKKIGDFLNIERSAKFGDEIGGHLMSGHISCKGIITSIDTHNNYDLTIEIPNNFIKYVLYKGFIGIDGASLTVGEVKNNSFKIHLIPETLAITTFKYKKVNDEVNIEIDANTQAIIDTVEKTIMQKYN